MSIELETWCKQIFQTISGGMRIIDRDFNVIGINNTYSKLFGISEDDAVGKKCYEILGSSMCHTPDCPLMVILNGETHAEYEMQADSIDESSINYISNARPFYGADGEILGIIEEVKDTTEYKRVIDELKIRDSILASSINAIAVADLEGRLTYVNRAFLDMWECDVKGAFSKPVTEYWQMESSAIEALGFLYERGRWVSEGIINRIDGSLSYVQILASMVTDETDNPICIVTSFIDITELKRVKESKLRAQTALAVAKSNTDTIKSIMDAVVIAIAITDLDGKMIRINKGFTETFGFGTEIIGKNPTDFIVEKDIPKVINGMNGCVQNNHASSIECSAITNDKEEIIIIIDFTLMRDSRGTPTGVIVVIRDITEQKRSAETRERLSNELMQKNKELEQLIRIVSHDLRSPLVNIQGFSNELGRACDELRSIIDEESLASDVTEKISPILDEEVPEMLRYILISVSKIDSLLSGLLRISRLGRVMLNTKNIDMNELMTNVIGAFEFQIKQAGVTLTVGDIPPCIADEEQINQVFSNLLNNALKYLDPKKVGAISIIGWNEAGESIYCVEDNGLGIAPEHQERIFDMFYRLNPNATPGEGLGLNIIRKVLDRHNGKVWVESEYEKGSKFFISLPTSKELIASNSEVLTHSGT
ncbi:MAG: sensor histidine kinase [Candidatus Poribacteria bacterium]|nr:sensor histidine kinase [Candidatus Poribacteria bacterium]